MKKIKKRMKNNVISHLLAGLVLLAIPPLSSMGQVSLTLDEVIRQAQDSAITAFQSRQELQSRLASYEAFESLRKPQLSLKIVPNYTRIVSDPTRDYVYLRNFDILSTSAQVRLTQKVLPFGGEAYVAHRPSGVSSSVRVPLAIRASSWPVRCCWAIVIRCWATTHTSGRNKWRTSG